MTTTEIWKHEQALIAEARLTNGLTTMLDKCDGCGRVCMLNTNGLHSVCYDCKKTLYVCQE